MKFNCGLSWADKRAIEEDWHLFFAIWPRRVGKNDCRWLETIERKKTFHSYPGGGFETTKYRALNG